mmetsp:Transcript_32438/g.54693  ORF Transcript_32438/g.54693 Transcript_32438/m.54693 type:complete len:294 (-) Transcript_32438:1463-2344(-)
MCSRTLRVSLSSTAVAHHIMSPPSPPVESPDSPVQNLVRSSRSSSCPSPAPNRKSVSPTLPASAPPASPVLRAFEMILHSSPRHSASCSAIPPLESPPSRARHAFPPDAPSPPQRTSPALPAVQKQFSVVLPFLLCAFLRFAGYDRPLNSPAAADYSALLQSARSAARNRLSTALDEPFLGPTCFSTCLRPPIVPCRGQPSTPCRVASSDRFPTRPVSGLFLSCRWRSGAPRPRRGPCATAASPRDEPPFHPAAETQTSSRVSRVLVSSLGLFRSPPQLWFSRTLVHGSGRHL